MNEGGEGEKNQKNIKRYPCSLKIEVFHVFGEIFVLESFSGNINPLGAAGDETLVFGNLNFTRKSGFEKHLVDRF